MKKKIVIIGGGVAGLSTGIYSQLNGFSSEIIEMHSRSGGQCTAWDRKGYRFDYCLHWLVGSSYGAFSEIWKTTDVINNEVEVINHDIFARVVGPDGDDFIVYSDIDRWEEYLCEMAPEDINPIHRMCRQMKRGASLETFSSAPGMRTVADYTRVLYRMLPALTLLGRYKNMSSVEYIKRMNLKNEKLKWFMTKLYGESNFSALAILFMLGWFHSRNAGYLIGGSQPIAERMEKRYRSLGGETRFRTRVEKILVENNRARGVILEDGTLIDADYVVSAADGYSTIFKMLEGKYVSEKVRDAYDKWELFTPLVQVSFGIGRLVATEFNATTYFAAGEKIGRTVLRQGYSILNQSAYDPTMAPEGKTTMIMRFESPWDLWENLEGDEYRNEKENIRQDSVKILEGLYPGISGAIEVIDVATPKTDVRYTGVHRGAYEGFMPSGDIMRSIDMELPGLSGFYMAGQWLFPGGGLPPSAQSGSWVVQKICKNERQKFISNYEKR
ncbi:MAG: NAD(P)/FAD-dependent oxidoreductase [Bacteroidia bacterium]|nr:MAG: NAD(P)/FAD-dependent oxidoreductase [Bacteroidia bacterium]